jgi:CHAT domain-containing protein/Flp pilus assembly protein TadD
MKIYRQQSDPQNEATCFLLLGLSDLALADATAARIDLEQGAEKLAALGDRFGSWLSLWMLAELEKREGRFEDSISRHERALALLHEAESSPEPFSLEGLKSLVPIFGLPANVIEPLMSQPQIVKPILLRFAELISRDSFGDVLVQAGQLEKAEVELEKASALSTIFGGLFDTSVKAHVGSLRRRQWRFDEARESYRKALDAVKLLPTVPFRDEWVEVRILGELAELELLSGRTDEALAWNERALGLVRSPGNRAREAVVLQDRANLLLRGSRLGAAEPVFYEALEISKKNGDVYRQASILADTGALNMFRGTYGTAVADFEKSIEIFQKLNKLDDEAQIWSLMSEAYLLLSAHGSARTALEKAVELAKKSGFRPAQTMAEMLTASEKYLSGKGSTSDLEKFFVAWWELPETRALMFGEDTRGLYRELLELQQTAAQPEITISSSKPQTIEGVPVLPAMSLFIQGKLLFERGELAPARDLWLKALEKNPSKDLRAGFLAAIGATFWREGKTEEALRYFVKAADTLELTVEDVRVEEMLASYLGSERRWYFEILIELLVRQGHLEEAFDYSERARARAFLQLVGNRRLKPAHGADEQLVREAEALRTQILDWERQISLASPVERIRIATDLKNARLRYQSLMIRLKVSNPEYASLTKVEPLQIQAVREELPPETTLISYFVSSNRIHAWVLDRTTFQYVSLPLEPTDLRRMVCWADQLGHRNGVRGARAHDPQCGNDRASSEEVFAKLFAPLREKIRNPRLILIPHSVLHYLPFAALRDPQTGRYLIEDYTLTYAPSASALRFLRGKETPVAGRALVLGDPDTELGSLPGAKREAAMVSCYLGTTPLLGRKATESALYHLEGKVDLLHIAAHGFYDPASPLFSHIALAPGEGQDGNLEVHEILANLDLSGVNLVVLSACQTAIGERSGGDEVVGLTRALLYAGSPGVISTLWNIDDEAAAVLMEELYARLLDGGTAADALRQAQLALLRNPVYHDPSFWAAFSLTGDPQGLWRQPAESRQPSQKPAGQQCPRPRREIHEHF